MRYANNGQRRANLNWRLALGAAALLILVPCAGAREADIFDAIAAGHPDELKAPQVSGPEIWKDPSAPLDARVHDLVRRMSPAEKVSQLLADAPAIPRLGIPSYSYRNECIHGLMARVGAATVFPQVIGMAATWDRPLIHNEAAVIATEARAHFNDYTRTHDGNCVMHTGLSFYAPNINIVRDPRWGRGQETYGEDPFLTAQMSVAFIRGLQGDNPSYVKALAGAKHYAVHDGPEHRRSYRNVNPPERDLYDTYLPAFEAAVREGHVGSVMGAYSALHGVPDCENPFLLTQLLRRRWGFQGFVVSDGGAIFFDWAHHKHEATPEEAAANAVKAGCDLFSANISRGNYPHHDFRDLGVMLSKQLLSQKEIDAAVSRTYKARFRLGLFDPPSMVPWSKITMAQNDTPEHRALALKVARESIVLLKNNGLLPLDRAKIKRLAVIGPNADSVPALKGNYAGRASRTVTILAGIKAVAGPGITVTYQKGVPLAVRRDRSNRPTAKMLDAALSAARSADVVIYVGGLNARLESEETGPNSSASQTVGFYCGDRTRIELPVVQAHLLKMIQATGKPVVFVDCSGSAIAMPWAAKHLPAIVQAWYPGEEGGRAVADVLFGNVNPAGRLPITFYRSTSDLPEFENYSMADRTYRYFPGKPLFAFGYGLSYTKFDYKDAKLNTATFHPDDTIKLTFKLANSGSRDGDEVAQVYFRAEHPSASAPRMALCGFERVHLAKGDRQTLTMDIPVKRFREWDTDRKQYTVEPGSYELLIGAASDDIRLRVPVRIAAE